MACSGCNASIDCPDDVTFPYSLTSGPVLPFLLECPSGYDCSVATTLTLNCCDHILTLPVPYGATQQQVSDILNALTIQCQQYASQCGLQLPPPFTGTVFTGNPFNYFTNKSVTATATCPDGTVTTFALAAGSIADFSASAASSRATSYAQRQVSLRQICLGSLASVNFVGNSYSEAVTATGAQVNGLTTNPWSVVSGSAPAGMTLGPSIAPFTTLPLTGTPTTAANYSFTVRFTVPSGDSVTKTYNITVTAIPILTATAGTGSVACSWTTTSADSYQLMRSVHNAGSFSVINTTSGTSFTDVTCTPGTAYDYRIDAYSSGAFLVSSAVKTATPAVSAPTLSGTAGNAQNVLSWTSVTGATNYSLYRGLSPGVHPTLVTTTGSLGYTDTGLTNGTAYYYVVVANYSGGGTTSNEVSETPAASPTLDWSLLTWGTATVNKETEDILAYSNHGAQVSANASDEGVDSDAVNIVYQNVGTMTYTGGSVSSNLSIDVLKWINRVPSGTNLIEVKVVSSADGTLVDATPNTVATHNYPFTVPSSTGVTLTVTVTLSMQSTASVETTGPQLAFYAELTAPGTVINASGLDWNSLSWNAPSIVHPGNTFIGPQNYGSGNYFSWYMGTTLGNSSQGTVHNSATLTYSGPGAVCLLSKVISQFGTNAALPTSNITVKSSVDGLLASFPSAASDSSFNYGFVVPASSGAVLTLTYDLTVGIASSSQYTGNVTTSSLN